MRELLSRVTVCEGTSANYKSRFSAQINEDLLPQRRSSSQRNFVVFDEVKVPWFMNVISIRGVSPWRLSDQPRSWRPYGSAGLTAAESHLLRRHRHRGYDDDWPNVHLFRDAAGAIARFAQSYGRLYTWLYLWGIGAALCINHCLPFLYLTLSKAL